LFNNEISAWTHGPVAEDLYHTYKCNGSNPIPEPHNFDQTSLTKDEFNLVEEVFEVFGQYSS
jgi:uncharacterized phage-associated protein